MTVLFNYSKLFQWLYIVVQNISRQFKTTNIRFIFFLIGVRVKNQRRWFFMTHISPSFESRRTVPVTPQKSSAYIIASSFSFRHTGTFGFSDFATVQASAPPANGPCPPDTADVALRQMGRLSPPPTLRWSGGNTEHICQSPLGQVQLLPCAGNVRGLIFGDPRFYMKWVAFIQLVDVRKGEQKVT